MKALRQFVWIAVGLVLALSACDAPTKKSGSSIKLVSVTARSSGKSLITTAQDNPVRFFSKENLRATNFSGNIDPNIARPASGETTGYLNTAGVNTPAQSGANSEFQMEISDDLRIEPLRNQQVIGGQWQPDVDSGSVSLNFENEPLTEVIEDVFGGILSVNYLISPNVSGQVTFRTDRRIPYDQLVQVMADILARYGYLIQYFNSVYHIGPAEELDQMTGLRNRTALQGDSSTVVQLRATAPDNIAEIANALIPPGNTVVAMPENNSVIVSGDPSQFASIRDLLLSLAGDSRRTNFLAIHPLRRSAPELVANQLGTVYAERNLGDVAVLPLEQRNGILIIATSQKLINEARQLARGLDVNTRDPAKLRIIQLTHLDATDTAAQLGQVFGAAAEQAPSQPVTVNGTNSDVIQAAIDRASAGESAEGVSETGSSISATRFIRGKDSGDSTSAKTRSSDSAVAASTAVAIAADPRNNALLVRSSFAEFKRISAAVKALDVPLAQVVLEATIVEVLINDALQYGVQTFLERGNSSLRTSTLGAPADPGGAGFSAVLDASSGNLSAQFVLTALQSVTDLKVISSPYLTMANGATSRLSVGDQIPFVTASQTSSSDGNVTVTQEVETRDIGVILEVTPKISPDNSVVLNIRQEVSSTANVTNSSEANPTISQRTIESRVTVQSGSTILLGGLVQERADRSVNGVPVLSKVPVLGEAFKTTSDTQRRSELVVMITPRVVRNSNQINDITQQLKWHLVSSR